MPGFGDGARLGRIGRDAARAQEKGCGNALLLEDLKNLIGVLARRTTEGKRDVFPGFRLDGNACHHGINGLFHHAAVLRLAGDLAGPHFATACFSPRLDVLDGTRALKRDIRLKGRRLDVVLLVGVATIFDGELLAASEFDRRELAVFDLLLSQLDRDLLATALSEHGIVHRKQIAGADFDTLGIDKLLEGRIDAHLDRRAVKLHVDIAIGIADNSRDKQQKRAAHSNERIRIALVGTRAATSTVAVTEPLRMVQIRGPRFLGTATRRRRKLLTYGCSTISGSFFIRGVGRGVLRQCVSPSPSFAIRDRR